VLFTVAATVLVLGTGTTVGATTINFDEFPSPPVTCCYGNPVVGPLIYPEVTVVDGAGHGQVMNGNGWNNLQTSGDNLFGTLCSQMNLNFNEGVGNLEFDLINGDGAFAFTVTAYNQAMVPIDVQVVALPNWGDRSGVRHIVVPIGNVWKEQIVGNFDFAIDTVTFNAAAVPEPASLVLLGGGLLAGIRRLRRRS